MARSLPLVAAFSLLSLAQAASAQTQPCWTSETIGAARVREMEVMVMAVGLRCRSLGYDITGTLEKFRTVQKNTILQADNKLRAHYGATKSKAGKVEYDRFLTRLGNSYGAGSTDARTCKMFELVAEELGKPNATADSVELLALDLVRDPQIIGERCSAQMANTVR